MKATIRYSLISPQNETHEVSVRSSRLAAELTEYDWDQSVAIAKRKLKKRLGLSPNHSLRGWCWSISSIEEVRR